MQSEIIMLLLVCEVCEFERNFHLRFQLKSHTSAIFLLLLRNEYRTCGLCAFDNWPRGNRI